MSGLGTAAAQDGERAPQQGSNLIRLRPRAGQIVLGYGDTVMACEPDGSIEPGEERGLFVHETRAISRYQCRARGRKPQLLAQSQLNPQRWLGYYLLPAPGQDLREACQHAVELRWSRLLGSGLHEDLDITNYSGAPVALRLSLHWQADFADMAETREGRRQRGRLDCDWHGDDDGGRWRCRYRFARRYRHQGHQGRAAIDREAVATVRDADSAPRLRGERICFEIRLAPGQRWHACIDWQFRVEQRLLAPPACPCRPAEVACLDSEHAATRDYLREAAAVIVPGQDDLGYAVAATLERVRHDLASLRLRRLDRGRRQWTVAAGMPAFAAFFGRDAALVAWQSALLGPELLHGTLAELEHSQGRETDDWRDEQRGRMLHEARTGPLACLRYNPLGRYYGALNSSTLFPIALLQLWSWSGDRERVGALLPAAQAALAWLDREAREGHDGFYGYATRSRQGLENQSWKDSEDALVDPDGRPVQAPAATCEEQAQAYQAKLALATLWAEFGREDDARDLYAQAQRLRQRFDRAFWSERHGYYALAVDAHGRAIHSVASNPIHCLATGIAGPEQAQACMRRLMDKDMFSGWGIRTLSAEHPSYNPYAYHRGTVWPAEHGPLALGAMRYGLRESVWRLCRAQFEAAALFDHHRLPECFGGQQRSAEQPFPSLYPYANWPQAWSSTTALSLIQALLGLQPIAHRGVLRLDPQLPVWLPALEVRGLRVGAARVDLRFERCDDGATRHRVLALDGALQVLAQPSRWPGLHYDDFLRERRRDGDARARDV
ncbi:glycogen debranching N-terminal domain-containing protein [Lysobacter firmicutimachus]|uniref:Glycogen debranching N-terminal domain-containing protein n=1 Tax=Lysobacter firmicutimachus TaxID=1792846 RepID=A0AAU8MNW9_9GAMM